MGECVTNLVKYVDIGTHWIALYSNDNTKTYFDSFGVEHILKEIKMFINEIAFKGSTITINMFRIQAYDSVMRGIFVLDLFILCLKVKT